MNHPGSKYLLVIMKGKAIMQEIDEEKKREKMERQRIAVLLPVDLHCKGINTGLQAISQ